MPPQTEAWHLDKKVPITILVGFVCQTMVFIYIGTSWKTETDYRIISLEKINEERKSQEGRIIAMEQQLRYITEGIRRIESSLSVPVRSTDPGQGQAQ